MQEMEAECAQMRRCASSPALLALQDSLRSSHSFGLDDPEDLRPSYGMNVYAVARPLREFGGPLYENLPPVVKNGLTELGICHFMTVFETPRGEHYQFDFGPVGGDIEIKYGKAADSRNAPSARAGEIREEQLNGLPETAFHVGWTHLDLNDIRSYNRMQDTRYILNRNDCRHYVNKLCRYVTGRDEKAARALLRYMSATRRTSSASNAALTAVTHRLKELGQLALDADSLCVMHALGSSVFAMALGMTGIRLACRPTFPAHRLPSVPAAVITMASNVLKQHVAAHTQANSAQQAAEDDPMADWQLAPAPRAESRGSPLDSLLGPGLSRSLRSVLSGQVALQALSLLAHPRVAIPFLDKKPRRGEEAKPAQVGQDVATSRAHPVLEAKRANGDAAEEGSEGGSMRGDARAVNGAASTTGGRGRVAAAALSAITRVVTTVPHLALLGRKGRAVAQSRGQGSPVDDGPEQEMDLFMVATAPPPPPKPAHSWVGCVGQALQVVPYMRDGGMGLLRPGKQREAHKGEPLSAAHEMVSRPPPEPSVVPVAEAPHAVAPKHDRGMQQLLLPDKPVGALVGASGEDKEDSVRFVFVAPCRKYQADVSCSASATPGVAPAPTRHAHRLEVVSRNPLPGMLRSGRSESLTIHRARMVLDTMSHMAWRVNMLAMSTVQQIVMSRGQGVREALHVEKMPLYMQPMH
eukprot:jgi/Mesvir1/17647/Mv08865-RA.1